MNLKNNVFLLVFLAFMLDACKKESSKVINSTVFSIKDFPVVEHLKGVILETDSLLKPIKIWVDESSLVTIDMYADYLAQIYDKKTGKKIAENIPRGIGPNEFLNCWSLQFTQDMVWAFDMQQAKLSAFDRTNFTKARKDTALQSVKINGAPTTIAVLPDNSFICSDLNDLQNLVTRFDANGNNIENVETIKYPEIISEVVSESLIKRFWENRIYYNQQNNKIVIFYTYCDLIEIYNPDMSLDNRIQGPDLFLPVLGSQVIDDKKYAFITDETKFAYLFGVLTDKEIWALYYGVTPQEGQEKQQTIFVFDYCGNPLRHYELDIPITYFDVDISEKCIYGLSEQPDPVIVKYKY